MPNDRNPDVANKSEIPLYDRLIVGGGITGWAAAWKSSQLCLRTILIDKSKHWGGSISTVSQPPYLIEGGPHSLMVQDADVDKFLRETGLEDKIITANATASKRYVVRKGSPVALPHSFLSAISKGYISWAGKARVLCEPLLHGKAAGPEEAIGPWVRRHFGKEVEEQLLDPFLSGIYAGDPSKISLRHAFPRLHALASDHSSFLLSALKKRKAKGNNAQSTLKPSRRMLSFPGGLIHMVDHLRKNSPNVDAYTDTSVASCTYNTGVWTVTFDSTDRRPIRCKEVLLCIPPHGIADFPFPPSIRKRLEIMKDIEMPPVKTVALAYKKESVLHPLDGFGLLCPIREKRSILGVLFDSAIFPGRAPENEVLVSVFMGGTRQPEMAHLDDAKALTVADGECRKLLNIQSSPVAHHITHWEKAIPQYTIGYENFLNCINEVEQDYPTLCFAGNARDGVSLGACILSGVRRASKENT